MWRASLIVFVALAVFIGIRTVRIDGKLRMVESYADEQGLHHVYFTEPGNDRDVRFLGEEIFRNGEKILDTYRENDGVKD